MLRKRINLAKNDSVIFDEFIKNVDINFFLMLARFPLVGSYPLKVAKLYPLAAFSNSYSY